MKKLKIKGVTNSTDSIWFRLEANAKSLERLDEIFNLTPQNSYHGKGINYKNAMGKEGKYFLIEDENCTAYIILSEYSIHLILRRIKNFKSVKENFLQYFELK